MLIRDGRNNVHDLGPRRVWSPSDMKFLGASGMTGNGRWSDKMMTIVWPTDRAPRAKQVFQYYEAGPCEECDKTILTAHPSRARFCSTKCRNRVAKQRQRERERLSKSR